MRKIFVYIKSDIFIQSVRKDFAATYTKNSPNEENSTLKYRHSYFAHLGKLLRG